jgi:Rrf2 family cysteine metabolism transcriptional repressor
MMISTKGRYASRLMLDIAINSNGDPVSLKDIAKRQQISEKYLEQIISVLNKAGMVRSIRGAQGGYVLTREPKNYTIGQILEVTEGSMVPVECLRKGSEECEKRKACTTVKVWEKIDNAISGVIDNITLEDMKNWSLEDTP